MHVQGRNEKTTCSTIQQEGEVFEVHGFRQTAKIKPAKQARSHRLSM